MKLNHEKEKILEDLNYVERIKNKELEELRIKMEQQHRYSVDNIQTTHENQINILNGEIQDYNIHLQLKEKELIEYIQKYEKVELIIRDFVNHPEKLRDRAEVSTIKNLYESLRGTRSKSPSKSPTKSSQFY